MKELTKNQVRSYMIQKAQKVWNTEPERQFNDYQRSRSLGLIQNITLRFAFEGKEIPFQCDFLRPTDADTYAITGFHNPSATYDIDFEIDGEQYHSSPIQMRKDRWKDGIKNSQGLRVIHIPAELTKKKWWQELDKQLTRAVLSDKWAVYLVA